MKSNTVAEWAGFIQDESMLAAHCHSIALTSLRAGDSEGFHYWIHKARRGLVILRAALTKVAVASKS